MFYSYVEYNTSVLLESNDIRTVKSVSQLQAHIANAKIEVYAQDHASVLLSVDDLNQYVGFKLVDPILEFVPISKLDLSLVSDSAKKQNIINAYSELMHRVGSHLKEVVVPC